MKHDYIRAAFKSVSGLLVFLFATVGFAQTVSPVIGELGNPAKGHVEYVNDADVPLNVVLEAKSFEVSETGDITYRPLDANIHLKLSTTSFRIQPKQRYFVFYEANSPQSPNWFVIYASFTGFPFRTAEGMNVKLLLPHTVYLLPKQSVQKSDLRVVRAELNAAQNKAVVEVENQGANFGRVLQTDLIYSKKKQEAPGFPVFPHSKRIMEIPLDQKAEGENVPLEVNFQFQNFKLEEKLRRSETGHQTATVDAKSAPQSGGG